MAERPITRAERERARVILDEQWVLLKPHGCRTYHQWPAEEGYVTRICACGSWRRYPKHGMAADWEPGKPRHQLCSEAARGAALRQARREVTDG